MTARPALSGLHHVAIIASDYERSKAFYVDVLGLRIVDENHRAERDSWKLDLAMPCGAQIELFSFPDVPARVSRPEAAGLRHLALRVEDIDAWIAHLYRNGIDCEPIRIDPYTGARFSFFADPDDLPVELYENTAHDYDRTSAGARPRGRG